MKTRKWNGRISYSVSAGPSTEGVVFRELRFPDGSRVRVMNRQVFDRAARRANAKLAEAGRLPFKK